MILISYIVSIHSAEFLRLNRTAVSALFPAGVSSLTVTQCCTSSYFDRMSCACNNNSKKNRQQAETTLTRSGQPTEAGILKEKGSQPSPRAHMGVRGDWLTLRFPFARLVARWEVRTEEPTVVTQSGSRDGGTDGVWRQGLCSVGQAQA